MKLVKDGRIGMLTVSSKVFESAEFQDNFWQLGFIPTEVHYTYYGNSFEMTGYSPLFSENPQECLAPNYIIIFERHGGNNIKLRVERR